MLDHLADFVRRVRSRLLGAFAVGVAAFSAAQGADAPAPPGASAQVRIYRDDWGVPHIYAANESDAFFGVGYALAQDNLHAILRSFAAVQGGLARAFGPEHLDRDFEMLQWSVLEEARRGYEAAPPDLQLAARRYVAGVQLYMEQHPQQVPAWAPPLEPALPFAYGHMLSKMISLLMPGNGWADCESAGVIMPAFPQIIASVSPDAVRAGLLASNQWVLAPARTSLRTAYLWADSHSGFDSPRDEIRIHAGSLHASGIVPAGTFLPLIGHSEGVAWAFTMGAPDVSDCYRARLSGNDRYVSHQGERAIVRRQFSVSASDGSSAHRTFEFLEINGALAPVVARHEGYVYAIATPYLDGAGYTEQLYAMNKAKDLSEFRRALSLFGLFPQNIMAADTRGDSQYVRFGRAPIRHAGVDTTRPLDVADARTHWRGVHPLDELVGLANPPDGYMQNNNIAPDRMTISPTLRSADFASYLFNDAPGRANERAVRSLALLSKAQGASPQDFESIGMDSQWPYTSQWQAALRAALADEPAYEPQDRQAFPRIVERLLAFDGRAVSESVAALNYFYWRYALRAEDARLIDGLVDAIEGGAQLSAVQRRLLLAAVDASVELMLKNHGGLDKTYGEVFRIGRSGRSFPLGGGSLLSGTRAERTLRSMGCMYAVAADGQFLDKDGQCLALGGQRHPILTVLSKPIVSFSAVPFGQSADPGSPHHLDQAQRLASKARLKPTYFQPHSLRGHIRSVLTLAVRELVAPAQRPQPGASP